MSLANVLKGMSISLALSLGISRNGCVVTMFVLGNKYDVCELQSYEIFLLLIWSNHYLIFFCASSCSFCEVKDPSKSSDSDTLFRLLHPKLHCVCDIPHVVKSQLAAIHYYICTYLYALSCLMPLAGDVNTIDWFLTSWYSAYYITFFYDISSPDAE